MIVTTRLARASTFYKLLLTTSVLSLTLGQSAQGATNPDAYSPQNVLIGATPSVQASANNGEGITVGVIDTGGTASWTGFQGYTGYTGQATDGKVNTSQSTCISPCPYGSAWTGNTDDNGHGTFVTSEIVGGIHKVLVLLPISQPVLSTRSIKACKC